jgi:hypothetical protein
VADTALSSGGDPIEDSANANPGLDGGLAGRLSSEADQQGLGFFATLRSLGNGLAGRVPTARAVEGSAADGSSLALLPHRHPDVPPEIQTAKDMGLEELACAVENLSHFGTHNTLGYRTATGLIDVGSTVNRSATIFVPPPMHSGPLDMNLRIYENPHIPGALFSDISCQPRQPDSQSEEGATSFRGVMTDKEQRDTETVLRSRHQNAGNSSAAAKAVDQLMKSPTGRSHIREVMSTYKAKEEDTEFNEVASWLQDTLLAARKAAALVGEDYVRDEMDRFTAETVTFRTGDGKVFRITGIQE